jgi:hypothetical protein
MIRFKTIVANSCAKGELLDQYYLRVFLVNPQGRGWPGGVGFGPRSVLLSRSQV